MTLLFWVLMGVGVLVLLWLAWLALLRFFPPID